MGTARVRVGIQYLLTGIALCGVCGAGLEVRSGTHGKKRAYFYSCSSYYRRGRTVCPNRYEIPMATADAVVLGALLDDLLTPDRLVALAERLVARAKAAHDTPAVDLIHLRPQLEQANGALVRLTAAVVAGGDVPSLVNEIKVQDARRKALEARIAVLTQPPMTFDAHVEGALRATVGEWRDVLGRQVAQARQVVTKLVEGRVTFAPEVRDGQQGFRFSATGTIEKLIEGLVPGLGSVPQRLIRPVMSWGSPLIRPIGEVRAAAQVRRRQRRRLRSGERNDRRAERVAHGCQRTRQ